MRFIRSHMKSIRPRILSNFINNPSKALNKKSCHEFTTHFVYSVCCSFFPPHQPFISVEFLQNNNRFPHRRRDQQDIECSNVISLLRNLHWRNSLPASRFVGDSKCVCVCFCQCGMLCSNLCWYTVCLDSCRGQAANEGDAVEAHSPEEGRAGGLHHKVLQENPQLREEGPDKQEACKSVKSKLQALHTHTRMQRG